MFDLETFACECIMVKILCEVLLAIVYCASQSIKEIKTHPLDHVQRECFSILLKTFFQKKQIKQSKVSFNSIFILLLLQLVQVIRAILHLEASYSSYSSFFQYLFYSLFFFTFSNLISPYAYSFGIISLFLLLFLQLFWHSFLQLCNLFIVCKFCAICTKHKSLQNDKLFHLFRNLLAFQSCLIFQNQHYLIQSNYCNSHTSFPECQHFLHCSFYCRKLLHEIVISQNFKLLDQFCLKVEL